MSTFVAPEMGPATAAFEEGRYAEAAPLYERAAIATHAAGDPLMWKMTAIVAVKAYAMAGDPSNAVRFATQTFDVLRSGGHGAEVPGVAKKCLESLRAQGHAAEADALSAHVARLMDGKWNDPDAPRLVAFCASCGAAVKPAEVVRPTPTTVACRYCGASLDAR
jgi:hypothetical protein